MVVLRNSRVGLLQQESLGGPVSASADGPVSGVSSTLPRPEMVAAGLMSKADALSSSGHAGPAIDVYDEVVVRFGTAVGPVLRQQVAWALIRKGDTLRQIGDSSAAIIAYDEVVFRSGETTERALRRLVTRALISKGETLAALGDTAAAIAVYDEVLFRSGAANQAAADWSPDRLVDEGDTDTAEEPGRLQPVVHPSLGQQVVQYGDAATSRTPSAALVTPVCKLRPPISDQVFGLVVLVLPAFLCAAFAVRAVFDLVTHDLGVGGLWALFGFLFFSSLSAICWWGGWVSLIRYHLFEQGLAYRGPLGRRHWFAWSDLRSVGWAEVELDEGGKRSSYWLTSKDGATVSVDDDCIGMQEFARLVLLHVPASAIDATTREHLSRLRP